MKNIVLIVSVLSVAMFLSGCTTVGPLVTNIYSNGKGELVVEKAFIELNTFTGSMKQINQTSSNIKVLNGDDGK